MLLQLLQKMDKPVSRWFRPVEVTSCETALCCRGARAPEESFENDLDRQLEDELSLEELMKHRQEPDKVCMVKLKWSFQVIQ